MGPFPVQDLHTEETKGTTPPALDPRAGLGAPESRAPILPRERVLWREAFYLGLSCANAATEAISSRLLSQPFRVVGITTSTNGTLAGDESIAILAAQSDLAGVAAADGIAQGVLDGAFEGLQGAQQRFGPDNSHIHIGSVIRNVPTRLHLVVTNASGAALLVAATISVEFLGPAEHTHDQGHGSVIGYP